ncbi:zincin-like metallopeptidase domain-containing protein [Zunongwangia sp. F363]|uniref:Zincin-like metallopeptidase domain-containing protein n=1 Tax=Autumnicola tepida TaxID=3075595 RepID=A0ABU3CBH0_9FLAO|nr:zincin-like metallopeptidase domain-containing protein [Zunongwangia sp. F363]MDT0643682.1 zincin-like metallopeptidase domain-containing protein [Zunongwangia sp. F363]
MENAVQEFNGLNGTVADRTKLKRIAVAAELQGQTMIAAKIEKLLRENPEDSEFDITLSQKEIERLPEECLGGLECLLPDEDFEGLEKAVSPDEIYQYITDLIINTIKKVGDLPWQREWKKTSLFNGYQALNFDSKKGYRGINFFLLNFEVKEIDGEDTLVPIQFTNPFFLTFKQIEKHGGKLKKGSTGKRVIYFTQLYHYEEKQPDGQILSFGSYNQKKFLAWIKKNQHKLQILKRQGWTIERLAQAYIPILKYYNVFHAEDVTGIDWGLIPKNENAEKPEKERITIAEKVIEKFPNPPKIMYKGDQPAYYPKLDQILMTPIEAFKDEQSYYCTFFHECVHSTGHKSRLGRSAITLGNLATKRDNAFEELIAEMGAVFLSAETGILFSTLDNSAKYLKGWNKRLVAQMEEDNRFFFRAASAAQAASDFILDRDKEGVPAYQNSLISESKPEKGPKEGSKKGPEDNNYPFSPSDIPYDTAYNAHRGTSFSPEKRAKSEQNSYFQFLKDTYDQLKAKAEKTGRLEEFENNFPRFQDGYKKRFLKHLESKNGLMSTMITGPANFPVRRMEKKNQTIYKRLTELVEYGDKAEKYILPFKSTAIKSGKEDTVTRLKAKLEKLEAEHQKMKDINKILRKYQAKKYSQEKRDKGVIEELQKFGYSEATIKKTFLGEKKLPGFMLSNSNANIKRIKERIAQEERLKSQESKTVKFPGGKIEFNPGINKIQIHFDDKPEKEVRSFLKKAGQAYKWSPKNKVWQRQLSTYYRYNRQDLFDFLGVKKETEKAPEKEKVSPGKSRLNEHQKKDDAISNKLTASQRSKAREEWNKLEKPVEWEAFLEGYAAKNSQLEKNPKPKAGDQLGLFGAKKKKGLNAPAEPEAVPSTPQIMTKSEFLEEVEKMKENKPVIQEPKPLPAQPKPVKNSKIKNMAAAPDDKPAEFYNVPGEFGKFLQAVEKKPKESVVITLDGMQGAGKTTTLYKAMNDFASGRLRSLFASLEEHPESSLASDKRDKYISPENQPYIDMIGDLDSQQEFYSLIKDYDIIFIDSWQKLLRMIGNIRLDEDLRKKFDGKVFVIIFQQTTDGRTKGGAEVVFDGDIIIKMVKEAKFADNYAYFDKNRYTKVPIEQIRYNIASGTVYNPEATTDVSDVEFEEVEEPSTNSRTPEFDPGGLIITPID